MAATLTESRPNLLYLVHRFPYPQDKGDRIRSFNVLKHLALKAKVHLACLADEPIRPEAQLAIQQYCEQLAIIRIGAWARKFRALAFFARGRTATEGAFHSPALKATLRAWARETQFDAVLASASSMVPYLQMEEFRSARAVVDLVDVDSQKWLDYAAASRGPRRWFYNLEAQRLRRLERSLPATNQAVTLVSQAEADLYYEVCSGATAHSVPNGVNLAYFQPTLEESESSCVFIGALDYRPNIEGLCWFCDQVWPQIQRRRPDARFYIVGRKPVPVVRSLAAISGVIVVGQVSDVRPHLARASVAVVPLRIARGIQNKILEALAMGKATVASPCCLQALGTRQGVHLLSASSPQEWTTSILRLLDDRELRNQLGSAGRQYVVQNHRWENCLRPLDGLLGLDVEATGGELYGKAARDTGKF